MKERKTERKKKKTSLSFQLKEDDLGVDKLLKEEEIT